MMQDPGPQEALDSVHRVRTALGERIKPHLGWELAQAVACGGIFAAFAVPTPWGSLAMVPFVLATTWLTVLYRRRAGVWISTAVCARARLIGLAFGLSMGALVLVVLLTSLLLDLRWPALVAGVLAALITFFGRRAWLRAIVEDLSGGQE